MTQENRRDAARAPLSNCLVFAWRRYRAGGYLIMRRSHHGWWPHFLHARSLRGIEVEHFVPLKPKEWADLRWWQKLFPIHVALFRGRLRRDDD